MLFIILKLSIRMNICQIKGIDYRRFFPLRYFAIHTRLAIFNLQILLKHSELRKPLKRMITLRNSNPIKILSEPFCNERFAACMAVMYKI